MNDKNKNYVEDEEEEEEGEEEEEIESENNEELQKEEIHNVKQDYSKNRISKKNVKKYSDDKKEFNNHSNTKGGDEHNIEKLIKKIKETEKKLNEKNNIINNLKKEIEDKENKIKVITKTNNKLQQSLNEFSKQVDDKLFNSKGIYDNMKKYKSNIKNNYDNEELKQKELNNAMNIIKILKNDNHRLQAAIDNYEKNTKLKDLENINRIKSDENSDLEKEIKILKKELNDYNICVKKCKLYEAQISVLNKENKTLKDNIKMLNNKLLKKYPNKANNNALNNNYNNNDKDNENNRYEDYLSPNRIRGIKNLSVIKRDKSNSNLNSDRQQMILNKNNKNIYLKLNHKTLNQSIGTLPSISKNKTPYKSSSAVKLNNYKKNYDNLNDILKVFFADEDIEIINKIFKNNLNGLEAFKLKLCIINKSKDSLNNKYNLEIKRYNERILSAQEQIEYLNSKIRESEVNYRVLQTQMNEFNIQKKLLQKKIKVLEADLVEKDNILKMNFADEDINNKGITNSKNDNNIIKYTEEEDRSSSNIDIEDTNNNNNKNNTESNKDENKNNNSKNNTNSNKDDNKSENSFKNGNNDNSFVRGEE